MALLILAAAGQLAARNFKSFGSWYAVHVYSVIVSAVGRFWGLVPVSASEMGLYALGLVTVWYVARRGKDWKAVKPSDTRSWDCMYVSDEMLAGFPHLYYRSNPEWVCRFLEDENEKE